MAIPHWPAMAGALLLTCLLQALPVAAAESGARSPWSPSATLLAEGRLTALERDALVNGRVVAKVIDTGDRSEVLSFAVVRVKTTPTRVLGRFRGVEEWRRDPWVLEVGRIGPSPSTRDLEALTLDAGDLKALSRCRMNECDVRLRAETIEQFRSKIDWSSPGRAAHANALFREAMSAYAASYLSLGNAALVEYANNDEPVPIGESLSRLILRSRFLGDASPDLFAYLERFPNDRPPIVEDFLYWVKERFWLMNVLSLNHSIVIDRATSTGRLIMAASKQLYASHYYETSLNLLAYVEDYGDSSYLVSLNRTRADIRRGGFNRIERSLVNHLVRRRIESQLSYLQQLLEAS